MNMRSNTRKLIPGFVSGFLLATILACGGTSVPLQTTDTPYVPPTVEFTPTFTPIPLASVVSLVSTPTEETGSSPDYTIKAQTPFLQGSEDLRITNFNNEMTLLTQEEIAKFKDNVSQTTSLPGATGSFFDQQYKLLSPLSNLVSLRFQIMIYIQGAAHPGTHSRTVTYDLEAGSDVKLADLFLPGSDYLEKIANYCIAQLRTRPIDFESFSSGAAPVPENYGNWNITPDGLLITFDEYQVAAYAAGAQEVTVPFADLQSIIDAHGPLAGALP
jgi:hypothetical protein